MCPRATVLVWVQNEDAKAKGFALGYTMKSESDGKDFLYIDLVCSRHKMATQMMEALENHAVRDLKIYRTALRASEPVLIEKVYKKKGYKRLSDACDENGNRRTRSSSLRSLDKYAGKLPGQPFFTDGNLVASTVEVAWQKSKQRMPTAKPKAKANSSKVLSALPAGWWLEGGENGWWMSKCLKKNNKNQTQYEYRYSILSLVECPRTGGVCF